MAHRTPQIGERGSTDDEGSACVRCRRGAPCAPCAERVRRLVPLVKQVVQQCARRLPPHVPRDDLFAAGLWGLVDSMRRGGRAAGDGFEGWARVRIRGAILDELRAQDWLSRRARAATVARCDGLEPSFHGLGELLAMEHGGGIESDALHALEARSALRAVARALEHLPPRERRIVAMHYFRGLEFKDISAEMGVSEPRISQLHTRALVQLRSLLNSAA